MIDKIIEKTLIIPVADSWEDKLTDLDVYQIWNHNEQINKTYRKIYGYDKTGSDKNKFVAKWFEKKYGKTALVPVDPDCPWRGNSATPEFGEWLSKTHDELVKVYNDKAKAESAKLYKKTYDDRLEDFRDYLGEFFNKIAEAVSSWKNIIKWTKRVVGLIVTAVLLTATYFVVNFVGKGILWLIDNWDWKVVETIGIVLAGILVIVGIGWVLSKFFAYIAAKGTSLWYIKVLYSFSYWCLWMPIKVIFWYFLWKLVIVNLSYFIAAGAKGFWFGVLGFLGIFGEYFGASYTDYCPEARWEGEAVPVEPVIPVTPVVEPVVTPVAPVVEPVVTPVAPVADPSTN